MSGSWVVGGSKPVVTDLPAHPHKGPRYPSSRRPLPSPPLESPVTPHLTLREEGAGKVLLTAAG